MIDRIDITRHVEPVTRHEAEDPLAVHETTAVVRDRVTVARSRQGARYLGTYWRLNSEIPGAALRERWPLSDDARIRLDDEVYAGRLTHRGSVRVHRLAWTVADLRGVAQPGTSEVEVALRLRTGRPLDLDTLRPRCSDDLLELPDPDPLPEPFPHPLSDVPDVRR